jgi:hypothetical protein
MNKTRKSRRLGFLSMPYRQLAKYSHSGGIALKLLGILMPCGKRGQMRTWEGGASRIICQQPNGLLLPAFPNPQYINLSLLSMIVFLGLLSFAFMSRHRKWMTLSGLCISKYA